MMEDFVTTDIFEETVVSNISEDVIDTSVNEDVVLTNVLEDSVVTNIDEDEIILDPKELVQGNPGKDGINYYIQDDEPVTNQDYFFWVQTNYGEVGGITMWAYKEE